LTPFSQREASELTGNVEIARKNGARARIKPRNSNNTRLRAADSPRICPEPGKPCSAYMEFRLFAARISIATEPMRRAGRCPHCLIDFLYDIQLIDVISDNVMQCDYAFYADEPDSIRNGRNLLHALHSLALPPFTAINFHYYGGEA
jgi:hypothetical protein